MDTDQVGNVSMIYPETQWRHVESSNIAAVAWPMTYVNLQVRFTSGAIYQYTAVPVAKVEAFMRAPSKGVYFAANIKNAYQCIKLVPVPTVAE